jgi:hypothetical protein
MAVLVIAEVQGQTQELYDGMIAKLGPALEQAKGFIAHGAGPAGSVWRVFEVWETHTDATKFFATHVYPNLPPGVKPKRTIVPLHTLMLGPLMMLVRERETPKVRRAG